jgi:P4 family phage/plasmid primase-like protien
MLPTLHPNCKRNFYSKPEKPAVLPVNLDAIPEGLRRTPEWILWGLELRNGLWQKRPLSLTPARADVVAKTGLYFWPAATNDPQAGWPFERVATHYQTYVRSGKCAGIGILLRGGLCGSDLDDSIVDGTIAPWAAELLAVLDTYTELSPSSTGVKSLLMADLSELGTRHKAKYADGAMEIYDSRRGRFFAITGHVLPGYPRLINNRQDAVAGLYRSIFGTEPEPAAHAARSNGDGYYEYVAPEYEDAEHKLRVEAFRDHLAASPGARQGEDADDYCFALACAAIHEYGVPEDDAVELLLEWGSREDNTNGDGVYYPWSRPEIEHKVGDASHAAPRKQLKTAEELARKKDDAACYEMPDVAPFLVDDEPEPPKPKKGSKEPKKDTARIAATYIRDRRPNLVFVNKEPHYYSGTHYVAEDDLDSDIRRWLILTKQPHNNLYVSNVANDIKALTRRPETLPFWRDGRQRDEMIPFKNGLLNLTKYLEGAVEFTDHTPIYVSDFCLGYGFDGDASCPLWLRTIAQIFEDDADKIALLQEWYGYCFTDDQEHHKMLLKIGVTRSGKGTTDHVLEGLVGKEYCCGVNIHRLVGTYGCGNLIGKKVGLIQEVHLERDTNKYAIMEVLKNITGMDLIDIERKYKDPVSLRLPIKLSISANDMPRFFDASGALSSRLLILRYNRSFETNPDRALRTKLAAELPGVALWALDGLKRLRTQGCFTEPEESRAALTAVRRGGSPCLAFIQDCCEVSRTIDPGNLMGVELVDGTCELPKQEFRDAIAVWGEENDTQTNYDLMSKDLRSILPKLDDKYVRNPRSRHRVYVGIRLNADMKDRTSAWVLRRRDVTNWVT